MLPLWGSRVPKRASPPIQKLVAPMEGSVLPPTVPPMVARLSVRFVANDAAGLASPAAWGEMFPSAASAPLAGLPASEDGESPATRTWVNGSALLTGRPV